MPYIGRFKHQPSAKDALEWALDVVDKPDRDACFTSAEYAHDRRMVQRTLDLMRLVDAADNAARGKQP